MNKKRLKSIMSSLIMLFKQEKKIAIPVQTNTTELLNDKVALVIGGSGGIGNAIASSFLKNGARVIISGRNETRLLNAVEKLRGEADGLYSDKIKSICIDVTDVSHLPKKIKEASAQFEANKIDILVNSAGVINENDFFHTTETEFDNLMDINVKGTYFICQAMAQYMIENSIRGHILNVTSASSLRPAWTPYQISKWGIRGFTLGLADLLLPYGIIVNAIAPGPTATEMLGKSVGDFISNPKSIGGRYAMPEEIANLATFMVSEMGDLIVGDTFYITGGSGTISYHR